MACDEILKALSLFFMNSCSFEEDVDSGFSVVFMVGCGAEGVSGAGVTECTMGLSVVPSQSKIGHTRSVCSKASGLPIIWCWVIV